MTFIESDKTTFLFSYLWYNSCVPKIFLFDNVFTELMKKIKFLNQGANMRMTVFKVNIACQYLLKLLRFIQKILHCYNEMSSMHPNYKRHCSHCTSIQRTFWENLVPYLDFKHLQ